jgi:TolA-binding protein
MASWDKLNPMQRIEVLRGELRQLARSVERLEQHYQASQTQALRLMGRMDDIIATLAQLAARLEQSWPEQRRAS